MHGKFQINLKNKKKEECQQEEQHPQEKNLISFEVFQGKKFSCKLNGEHFRGPCKIHSCHANLPVNDSRCLYIFYPNKTEFDRLDILYALGTNEKKLRELQQIGKFESFCCVMLNNILSRLRDNNKSTHHCPLCGLIKSSNGPCLNKIECSKRIEFGDRFIKESFLGLPEMKATRNDLFILLNNKQKILTYLEQLDQSVNKPNLSQVFHISENMMAESETIKTSLG